MAQRFLTTHVGSLPRSQAVVDLIFARERGEAFDEANFSAVMLDAVDEVVRRQVAAGIDIVSDGEMSKISYATTSKTAAPALLATARTAPRPTCRTTPASSPGWPPAAARPAIAGPAAWGRSRSGRCCRCSKTSPM